VVGSKFGDFSTGVQTIVMMLSTFSKFLEFDSIQANPNSKSRKLL
jgi:hypothetical protein